MIFHCFFCTLAFLSIHFQRLLQKLNTSQSNNVQLPYLLSRLNELHQEAKLGRQPPSPDNARSPMNSKSVLGGESASPDTTICDDAAVGSEQSNLAVVIESPSPRRTSTDGGCLAPSADLRLRTETAEDRLRRTEEALIPRETIKTTCSGIGTLPPPPPQRMMSTEGRHPSREVDTETFCSKATERVEFCSGEEAAKLVELLEQARRPIFGDRVSLVDQVTDIVVNAHLLTCNYTMDLVAAGKARYYESQVCHDCLLSLIIILDRIV